MPTAELERETEVLVVGAGPTGLALGCALRQAGVHCTLIDQAEAGANTSRAAVIHARTLEVLEQIGVTDAIVREGHVVPRLGVRDRDELLLALDFGGLPTRYPYVLLLPQDRTEALLLERLEALEQRVHRSVRARSLLQDDTGVTVTLEDARAPQGTPPSRESIRARYVVGCDGMHSAVRDAAGISFTGGTYSEAFALADVHLEWPLPRDEVQLFFAPAGVMVVAPLPRDRHRVVATLAEPPEQPSVADVQALLDQRGPCARSKVLDVVWSSRFRVHHRIATHYRAGRVFVAGDAAHVHSPAGGQGMNTGIQDAVHLAELLVAVLSGRAEASSLERYEAERRPVAQSVLRLTQRLTRVATLDHPRVVKVRNEAIKLLGRVPQVRTRLAFDLAELDASRKQARAERVGAKATLRH
jgi:2-polyprenyl-6-methoxyphenol hydroxylase-like FAD-dependent oxidoreductase